MKMMEKEENENLEKKKEQIKKVLKHPATMVVIGGVTLIALMYSSKFFFDAAGHMVRSYKRFKTA